MSRNREEGLSIGQEHELIEKLKSAGISAKEVQAIVASPENALARKLVEVVNEQAKDTYSQNERLFDLELIKLREVGYPELVIHMLELQKQEVLEIAEGIELSEDATCFQFIPVIPREYRSAHDQFIDIQKDTKPIKRIVTPRINLAAVKYPEPIFEDGDPEVPYPYFMFDIPFGSRKATTGLSVEESRELFRSTGRKGLTDVELAALLLQRNWPMPGMHAANTASEVSETDYQYVVKLSPSKLNEAHNEDSLQIIGGSRNDKNNKYITPSCAFRLKPKLRESGWGTLRI